LYRKKYKKFKVADSQHFSNEAKFLNPIQTQRKYSSDDSSCLVTPDKNRTLTEKDGSLVRLKALQDPLEPKPAPYEDL
jgi:hypothetical protein